MKAESNDSWKLLFTPDEDPYMNMAVDEALVSRCADSDNGLATIRFYTWKEPSCSIGYFQKIETVFTTLKEDRIPVVCRPTGGGIVFHGNDITFSIVKRRVHDKTSGDISSFYKLIGESILRGLKELGFACNFYISEEAVLSSESGKENSRFRSTQHSVCSVTPARYDILINGSKVAGYAARRSQGVILCQRYLDVYEIWKDIYNDFRLKMVDLLYSNLVNSFKEIFEITLTSVRLSVEEEVLAHQIKEEKYSRKKWNYRK
ncbi:MAG: biotin/lipoate A/B protein ligase family protein [Candidatus Scalindua sp.]